MFFKSKNRDNMTPKLQLDHNEIEQIDGFKFLGFHLDRSLTFRDHTSHIINKLCTCVSILYKCKSFLSTYHLKLIFNAIGHSHINYAILNYVNSSQNHRNRIARLYNQCGSIIYNCPRSALVHQRWLSFDDFILQAMENFIIKIIEEDYYYPLKMKLFKRSTGARTRYVENNFIIPHINRSITKRAFSFWAPRNWAVITARRNRSRGLEIG